MTHKPFDSLEEMLSVEAMSGLERRTVARVEIEDWSPTPETAASGCDFLKVRSHTASDSRQYFVKRTSYATDIIMRLTDDYACRERLVWQHGLLDRLPPEVTCPILACARDGDGWALLMRDVDRSLQRLERWPAHGLHTLNLAEICAVVDALASLHAQFYRDSALRDPALGLCGSHQLFTSLSPTAVAREASTGARHAVLSHLRDGWALLDRLDAPDVASAMRALHEDPTPFVDALVRYPATLVHGDPKRENMGLTCDATPRLVLLDWQFVSAQPPAVDLAWTLLWSGPVAVSRETVIARYRDQLALRLGAAFDERDWEPQLSLALLGQCLRSMGAMLDLAYNNPDAVTRNALQAELPWWTEQARLGLKWL